MSDQLEAALAKATAVEAARDAAFAERDGLRKNLAALTTSTESIAPAQWPRILFALTALGIGVGAQTALNRSNLRWAPPPPSSTATMDDAAPPKLELDRLQKHLVGELNGVSAEGALIGKRGAVFFFLSGRPEDQLEKIEKSQFNGKADFLAGTKLRLDEGRWIFVGRDGVAASRSADGWKEEKTGVKEDLLAITADQRTAFAVGVRGAIVRRTTDKWEIEPSTSGTLRAVAAFDSTAYGPVVAVGDDGLALIREGREPVWSSHTVATVTLRAVTAGPFGFYAAGDAGTFVSLAFAKPEAGKMQLRTQTIPTTTTDDFVGMTRDAEKIILVTRHGQLVTYDIDIESLKAPRSWDAGWLNGEVIGVTAKSQAGGVLFATTAGEVRWGVLK